MCVLLAMIIYLICEALTCKCFVVLMLYLMKMSFYIFLKSDLDLFLYGILMGTRLLKKQIYTKYCFWFIQVFLKFNSL